MCSKRIDLTDQSFYHLTAIRPVDGKRWLFLCDCGETTVAWTKAVRSGHTKSCGCLRTKGGLGAYRRRGGENGFWDNLKWKNRSISAWAKHYDTTPQDIMQRLKRDRSL